MIVILDTAAGQDYNFRFRKDAAEFIGISQPVLRTWLKEPFYLHKTLIITHTSNEKVLRSNRELLKRHIQKIGEVEIEIQRTNGEAVDLSGVDLKHEDVSVEDSRPQRTAPVDRAG